MKKQVLHLLLLCSIGLASLGGQSTEETLIQGSWGEFSVFNYLSYWIDFSGSQEYCISYDGYFEYEFKGTYKIVGDKIYTYPDLETLTDPDMADYIPEDYKVDGMVWIFTDHGKEAVLYDTCIESENGMQFWNKRSFTLPGLIKERNGDRLITVEKQICRINDNSNIRSSPRLDSSKGTYNINSEDIPYLPKGREVILIGRSEEKDQVPGYERNYWYYVEVRLYPMEESGPQFGWIYGSLLDRETLKSVEPGLNG